jgi:hypothetical protein
MRITLGLTEEVTVIGVNGKSEQVTARIDTGATSSSIDAELAENLELGPINKTKIVKSASGTNQRPLVRAKIKLNGSIMEEEFTIADRAHMTYPVLIGQNILKKGDYLVDPNK